MSIDEIKPINNRRFFGYRSVPFSIAFHHVCEFNDKGEIINSFIRQSNNFSPAAVSEGGGILLIGDYLYVITPYEYTLSKVELNGKLIKKVTGKPSHYVPPSKNLNEEAFTSDLNKLKEFHNTWSHIRQIIQIDNMIGIVYAEPGESRIFLDLYDLDLNLIASDILIPSYVGRILSQGDRLYLLRQDESYINGQLPNPTIVEYLLKVK